jgi:regulator of sirC expression with transglutaminase-like and TPR domain
MPTLTAPGTRARKGRAVGTVTELQTRLLARWLRPVELPSNGMMDATERFALLAGGPEDDIALDEAALLIAAHAYPDLDVSAERRELDRLAATCWGDDLDSLIGFLFAHKGFRGNREHYADPRNSFLNQVLQRRLGIPITLALVLMEVGRRMGLEIHGVGMPFHFLARHGDSWIDPFDGGRLLDRNGCFNLYLANGGRPDAFHVSYLEPIGARAILIRMLTNLQQSYVRRGDGEGLAWVGRLRAMMPGVPLSDHTDQARLLVNLGRFSEAADVLEALAAVVTDDEAAKLESEAGLLRARLN